MLKKLTCSLFIVLLCIGVIGAFSIIPRVNGTSYFTDGFESGNTSAWTGTIGSPGVNTNRPHSGSYSAHFPQQTTGNFIYVYDILSANYSELWMRSYVYLVALPVAGDLGTLSFFAQSWVGPGSPVLYSTVGRSSDGQLQWGLHNNVASTEFTYNDSSIASGQWYFFEMHAAIGASAGIADLWINGVNVIHQTGQNLGTALLGRFAVGGEALSGNSIENYQDDVAVADSYISPLNPIVDQFAAPSIMYADVPAFVNCTITIGTGAFANVTMNLTGSVSLFWTNASSTFSIASDPNHYCVLNTSTSTVTAPNLNSYVIAWNVTFAWNYTEGSISVTNAVVYDLTNLNGTNVQPTFFTFIGNLVIQNATNNPLSPAQGGSLNFLGTVYYNGTTVAPPSGSVMINVSRSNVVEGSTNVIGSAGNFDIAITAPTAFGIYNWTIYPVINSLQNQTLTVYVHGGTVPENPPGPGPIQPPIIVLFYGSHVSLGVLSRGRTISFPLTVSWNGTSQITIENASIIGPNWTLPISLPMTFYGSIVGNGTAPINVTMTVPDTAYVNSQQQITVVFQVRSGALVYYVNCIADFSIATGSPLNPSGTQVQTMIGVALALSLGAVLYAGTRRRKPV